MSDVALLRLVLARELETINEYERYATEAESDELKAFFRHLAKEEKEHVSEAMALIHELDEDQAREWAEVNISADHFVNGKQAAPDTTETERAPDEAKGFVAEPVGLAPEPVGLAAEPVGLAFTVGSLKGT